MPSVVALFGQCMMPSNSALDQFEDALMAWRTGQFVRFLCGYKLFERPKTYDFREPLEVSNFVTLSQFSTNSQSK